MFVCVFASECLMFTNTTERKRLHAVFGNVKTSRHTYCCRNIYVTFSTYVFAVLYAHTHTHARTDFTGTSVCFCLLLWYNCTRTPSSLRFLKVSNVTAFKFPSVVILFLYGTTLIRKMWKSLQLLMIEFSNNWARTSENRTRNQNKTKNTTLVKSSAP